MQHNDVSLCPSFSAFFADRQAVADRVVNEASCESPQPQSELDEDEYGFAARRFENRDHADDFEFEVLSLRFPECEIFPIFNGDVVNDGEKSVANVNVATSSSSSEADETLESVEPWKEKRSPEASPGKCKKSKSTGSSCSKRWKLRDLFPLLRRSNSDGVFWSSTTKDELKSGVAKPKPAKRVSGEYSKHKTTSLLYAKEADKRKSYLPYRSGLLGFGCFRTV